MSYLLRPLLERGLEYLKEFPNLEDVEDAAKALSILVSMYVAQPYPPLDPRYEITTESLELLRREPELHAMLKRAHAEESYDLVRSSILIRKPRKPLPKKAQELLDEIRPLLVTFINDPTPAALWSSSPKPTDPASLAHMESLELMDDRSLPLVILKDLGSFMDDPLLASRVKNIFVRGKKTVLVNTSGSGKTRLTFEGLCHNWGFYFTTRSPIVIDLGSLDIGTALRILTFDGAFSAYPDSAEKRESNHSLAEQCLGVALLARLLIFRTFLEIAKESGLTEAHKTKWLLLQLLAKLRNHHGDIFQSLVYRTFNHDATEDIAETVEDIRKLLGSDFHLFLVLDEGQAAASSSETSLPRAFHTESGKRPVLLKFLDTWDKHLPAESFSCVIAGTDIPMHIFEGTKHADQVRWTSDTRSFDDQLLHERYLRRFLPSSLLDTQLGEVFLQRAWAWTRGRHRYTASLITEMLLWNFQQPNTVLNNYIGQSIKFYPTDGKKWTDIERSHDTIVPNTRLSLVSHVFSSLNHPNAQDTRSTLRNIIYHYLATDQQPPLLKADMIQAVSRGFGRFVDEDMKKIAFDEAIALTGMAEWMTQEPSAEERMPGTDRIWNYLTVLQMSPPPTAKAFAACLAFYFSRAFDSKRKLADIFNFPVPVPAWAKQPATLVELHAEADKVRCSVIPDIGIVAPLATSAGSLDEVVSWMEHSSQTPFCIPEAETLTPDMLFVLKLEDGAYIWVVMRVEPTTSDGGLVESLEETSLFCDAVRTLVLSPFLTCPRAPRNVSHPSQHVEKHCADGPSGRCRLRHPNCSRNARREGQPCSG
ncbi:hypothetical protein B0H12DRAFT_330584 [Mycena haematopus]|nr:hypothetical protein B0H12DRAFT_330584 [Mycena haematopus]